MKRLQKSRQSLPDTAAAPDSPWKYAWLIGSAALTAALLSMYPPFEARGPARRFAGTPSVKVLAALPAAPSALPAKSLQPYGVVTSAAGQLLAEATVCAVCTRSDLTAPTEPACVLTDQHGRFAFYDLKEGYYDISATARGFGSDHATIPAVPVRTGTAPQELRLVLTPGGSQVSGVVLDALGGPIAQARVRATRADLQVPWASETESDGEGRFSFWVSPGPITLQAQADGYAPSLLERAAPAADVLLILSPESQIRGRVVNQRTGRPVSGVTLRAAPRGGLPRETGVTSDEVGSFEIRGLEPDVYVLHAESDEWRGASVREVDVGLAEQVTDVLVEVVPAVGVLGHVLVSEKAAPCPRGLVLLGPPDLVAASLAGSELPEIEPGAPSVPSLYARIEPDGSARFRGVLPGRYFVTMQCFDHVLEDGPRWLDVGNDPLDVTWKVKAGLGLTVHVVDELRQAVAGARLMLLFPKRGPRGPQGAMPLATDTQGRARVPRNLFPGRYSLRLMDSDDETPREVVLRDGDGNVEVTLTAKGSGRVLVEVISDGAPVGGLQVLAREHSGASAARSYRGRELGDGRYELAPLPAGRYDVFAQDGINQPFQARAASGSAFDVRPGAKLTTRIELERSGALHGRVMDERGAPVANVWVSVSHEEKSDSGLSGQGSARALTDMEGEFSVGRLTESGSYVVRAEQPGGNSVAQSGVRAGTQVLLKLPSPGNLRGRVVDSDGRAASHCNVQVQHLESGQVRSAQCQAADGAFDVPRVSAGRLIVSAYQAGMRSNDTLLDVAPGETKTGIQLQLRSLVAPSTPPAVTGGEPMHEGSSSSPLRAAQDTAKQTTEHGE